MEYQKTINLLDTTSDNKSKFITKNTLKSMISLGKYTISASK